MKRALSILMALLMAAASAMASTTDSIAILKKIAEANSHITTLQAPYTHERISGNSVSHRTGDFYYTADGAKLAMRYTDPEGRYFVVADHHLHNKIGAVPMHFNTNHSSLMRLFGNCMVWAVSGEVQKIYEANNVDMTLEDNDDDNSYTITMTARSGFNKGISRIVLKYDRTSCLIFHLEVDEIINVNHIFKINRTPKIGHKINPDVFKI